MNTGARALLTRAAEALAKGDQVTAATLCERVLGEDRQSVDALNLLSLVRKRDGDAPQAERLMKDALALAPGRVDIHANLGNLYAALQRPAEAEAAYREALRQQPSFRPARIGLARLLLSRDRAAEASAEAKLLLEANAGDAEAWNVLGSAERVLGRAAEAEQGFRRALEIAPGYAVARHNLGALLASLSRNEEALEELDRAGASGLSGPELAHNRASALMALGRLDEAESLLRAGVSELPQAVALQMLLARIRYMRGDEGFADEIRQAVARFPDVAGLRVACSQVLRGAGRLADAEHLMRDGLARSSDDPRLLAEMSALLQDLGDNEQALPFAQRAVAAAPGDFRLQELVIQSLLSLGKGLEAMPLIEEARLRAPLDQSYIALEATAARLYGDPRYERLYDYERLVRRFELPVPEGWSTIAEFHKDLVPVLRERHQFVAPPLDQSLRGGTQTPGGLTGDPSPVVRAFLQAIAGPISDYCEMLGTDPGHPLSARNTGRTRITGCWSVLLRREGYHVNHVHSEGWISSAYYVEVPEEVRDREVQSGWIKFGEPKFFVPGAVAEKTVQPQAGTLVLFPSYMWHGTTPIHGDEPRMTIAFDAVPAE